MLKSKLSNSARNMNDLPCLTSSTWKYACQTFLLRLIVLVKESCNTWSYLKENLILTANMSLICFWKSVSVQPIPRELCIKMESSSSLFESISITSNTNDCPIRPTSPSTPRQYLFSGTSLSKQAIINWIVKITFPFSRKAKSIPCSQWVQNLYIPSVLSNSCPAPKWKTFCHKINVRSFSAS